MKTNRVLGLVTVCTLLAGVALALDFEDVETFPPPAEGFSLVGVDALANGSLVVYDGVDVYLQDAAGAFDALAGGYPAAAPGIIGQAGFVAARGAEALVGAASGSMWLFDCSAEAPVGAAVGAEVEGLVAGEYVSDKEILVSVSTETVNEVGLVSFNTDPLGAYTKVIELTADNAPRGIVCVDDAVYVGTAAGNIAKFSVEELIAAAAPEDEVSVKAALTWADGDAFDGDYGVFGPASATVAKNLLVGGLDGFQVVNGDGEVLDTIDVIADVLNVPIYNPATKKILVAGANDEAGNPVVAQQTTAAFQDPEEVAPWWQNLLRIVALVGGFMMLLFLILGLL